MAIRAPCIRSILFSTTHLHFLCTCGDLLGGKHRRSILLEALAGVRLLTEVSAPPPPSFKNREAVRGRVQLSPPPMGGESSQEREAPAAVWGCSSFLAAAASASGWGGGECLWGGPPYVGAPQHHGLFTSPDRRLQLTRRSLPPGPQTSWQQRAGV